MFVRPTVRPTLTAVIAAVTLSIAIALMFAGSSLDSGDAENVTLIAPTATRTGTVSTPFEPIYERAQPYPEGTLGYAISWPQCGSALPERPFDFGIIGVTGGRGLTRNPCFAEEWAWATRTSLRPTVYINLNYVEGIVPAGLPIFACDPRNAKCAAYSYGRAVAIDALEYASTAGAHPGMWWLDVQIASTWSTDVDLNFSAIRGAMDTLTERGVRVGISSTAFQWREVTGDLHPHGLPVWSAEAVDREMAGSMCASGRDFGAGPTEQIAYVANGFETVLACGRR